MLVADNTGRPTKRIDERDELQRSMPLFSQHDFDSTLENAFWPVGLKSDYPSEYCRRVAAAAVSYQLQLRSIDYTLKRYLDEVRYPEDGATRLDNRISQRIEGVALAISSSVVPLAHLGDENVGTFVAQVTFVRSKASIAALLTCANRGLLFEAISIARMLIEQIGWAITAVGNDDADAVRGLSATRSIRSLKSAYPAAGEFYGWLSDYAHWAYHAHINVIDWSGEKIQTVLASCTFEARAMMAALVVADCLVAAFQTAFPQTRDSEDLGSHRAAVQRLAEELYQLLPGDSVLPVIRGFLLVSSESPRS